MSPAGYLIVLGRMIFFGLAFMAIYKATSSIYILWRGEKAQGIIYDTEVGDAVFGDAGVEFSGPSDEKIKIIATVSKKFKKGDAVEVFYLKEDPSKARIKYFGDLFGGAFLFLFPAFIIGIFSFVVPNLLEISLSASSKAETVSMAPPLLLNIISGCILFMGAVFLFFGIRHLKQASDLEKKGVRFQGTLISTENKLVSRGDADEGDTYQLIARIKFSYGGEEDRIHTFNFPEKFKFMSPGESVPLVALKTESGNSFFVEGGVSPTGGWIAIIAGLVMMALSFIVYRFFRTGL